MNLRARYLNKTFTGVPFSLLNTTILAGKFQLLLDKFAGAAAAYSLRALSKVTTNVVKVRRDSDNAERDFTATEVSDGTLEAWVGTTASDNGFVTTWYDQSGNSNDATQATAASQPKIVDAGVLVTENGKAAIDFDGADDFLDCNDKSELTISNYPYSIFFLTNIVSGASIFWGNNSDTSQYISIESILYHIRNASYDDYPYDFTGNNVFSVLSITKDEHFIFNNSVETALVYAVDVPAGIDSVALGRLGDASPGIYSNQKAQEIILYPSDQSANRVLIERNIASYYGITLS